MAALTRLSTTEQLFAALEEARTRTLELIEDLSDEQMIGPRMEIVNPLRWEIGHVAWFQEYWVLRHSRGLPPIWPESDKLYDSARIPHDTRWDLPLPSKAETLKYVRQVLERITNPSHAASRTAKEINRYDEDYFLKLALYHEYMHAEAITYTRQTLAYPAPRIGIAQHGKDQNTSGHSKNPGDAEIPGGTFLLGSTPEMPFVFDNEQWAHEVNMKPFQIARMAVTNGEFMNFVEDGGYRRREWWSPEGWAWREAVQAEHPVYWKREANGRWLRRNFDAWVRLEERHPALHGNWYEADAYCRWADRRLPTEAEWEMAASVEPAASDPSEANSALQVSPRKRLFPWGDDLPTPDRANLDWRSMGCLDVDALPAGDSSFGCRQMIGNVWEWTATDFGPYPGFSPGPYKEYSAPWFGDHKVLRGGCWVTRSGLSRNHYRNFYKPHRRDVWAGFRTCAL